MRALYFLLTLGLLAITSLKLGAQSKPDSVSICPKAVPATWSVTPGSTGALSVGQVGAREVMDILRAMQGARDSVQTATDSTRPREISRSRMVIVFTDSQSLPKVAEAMGRHCGEARPDSTPMGEAWLKVLKRPRASFF